MALQPNIPFSDGDAWTPELAYESFQTPIFDDQPHYLGHRARITDNELSNTAGQIKDRVNFIESSLKVVREGNSGLTIRYNSGTVTLPGNSTFTIASALLAVPDNASSFIFVDKSGTPRVDSRLPVVCTALARVVTVNGNISQIFDLRHPNQLTVTPMPSSIKIFGGSSDTDLVTTHNYHFKEGYHYVRDLFIPANTTAFVDGFAKIFCSGTVNIFGSLLVVAAAPGIPVQAFNITDHGTVGHHSGAGLGNTGTAVIPWTAQQYGSGGGSGLIQCFNNQRGWGFLGKGGDGGGGIMIESARGIYIAPGAYIHAHGMDGGAGGTANDGAGAGFFNTASLPSTAVSGSGGGSGGLIYLSSLEGVTVAGALEANGGKGGLGTIWQRDDCPAIPLGGGGGGGGHIVILSPNINTTGGYLSVKGGELGDVHNWTNRNNYFSQVSPGVYRGVNLIAFLSGGNGGSYGGLTNYYHVTNATESGQNITYFTKSVPTHGSITLKNFIPLGN